MKNLIFSIYSIPRFFSTGEGLSWAETFGLPKFFDTLIVFLANDTLYIQAQVVLPLLAGLITFLILRTKKDRLKSFLIFLLYIYLFGYLVLLPALTSTVVEEMSESFFLDFPWYINLPFALMFKVPIYLPYLILLVLFRKTHKGRGFNSVTNDIPPKA